MRNGSLVVALCSLFLVGCTFTPHEVTVAAAAPREASTVGDGVTISLQVIDDRESTVVGQRGAGMIGADITAAQIMPVIERELRSGFAAKGFNVVDDKSLADAQVTARLRAFKFFIETGFWTGAENTSVAIGIDADRGLHDYEKVYRYATENRVVVVPEGMEIDQALNTALSDVFRQIFSDERLMQFLADARYDGIS